MQNGFVRIDEPKAKDRPSSKFSCVGLEGRMNCGYNFVFVRWMEWKAHESCGSRRQPLFTIPIVSDDEMLFLGLFFRDNTESFYFFGGVSILRALFGSCGSWVTYEEVEDEEKEVGLLPVCAPLSSFNPVKKCEWAVECNRKGRKKMNFD